MWTEMGENSMLTETKLLCTNFQRAEGTVPVIGM